MLWIKSLRIVFVASWFSGLFHQPRIFANLAMVSHGSVVERKRCLLMARVLRQFSNVIAFMALTLGTLLWVDCGIGWGPGSGWMHTKLAVVLLVVFNSF
jgi:putative membrane protein